MRRQPLVVILGPTAVGKTEVAIEVAKALSGEIVSADSMQIYRGMDIGTAKPTSIERQGIAHHLIDCVDPKEDFSVAHYQQKAKAAIADIHARGNLPILAGGTGLYVNSIVYPMDFTDAAQDLSYRKQLNQLAEDKGKEAVYRLLLDSDPVTAARLHYNDVRRVIRALEIAHLTGIPMSEYRQDFESVDLPYQTCMICLTMDREKLYRRIEQRVDQMLDHGLTAEVQRLLNQGYTKDLVSMQGLGYKEMIRYLEGEHSLHEAIEILKRDTRRFAKRQMTWFRREPRIQWVDTDTFPEKIVLFQWIISRIQQNISF